MMLIGWCRDKRHIILERDRRYSVLSAIQQRRKEVSYVGMVMATTWCVHEVIR